MKEDTWAAIIDESHKKGLRVAVHVYYLKDAKAAIDHGVDIIAHSIRDQDVTPELIAEMKQKNVSYIPTLTRDLSVFVYETTPDFIKDPFFQRGMSSTLHRQQTAASSSHRPVDRNDAPRRPRTSRAETSHRCTGCLSASSSASRWRRMAPTVTRHKRRKRPAQQPRQEPI